MTKHMKELLWDSNNKIQIQNQASKNVTEFNKRQRFVPNLKVDVKMNAKSIYNANSLN